MGAGHGADSGPEAVRTGHGADSGPDAVRLSLLETADGLGEADLLRLALQQAVAALGGLGGVAHLAGREEGTLRLAAVNGLPAGLAGPWEHIGGADDVAPARAVRGRRVVWVPQGPQGPKDDRGQAAGGHAWLPGGVLSAPLVVEGAPVGVLSVMTADEPDRDRRLFLGRLADLVSLRLPGARHWRSGSTPWWQEPAGVREQVMQQISVGTWSWDLDTGLLDIDEVTEGLIQAAGLEAGAWDHRIETWMERIHPDDRPGVQEAIELSLASGSPYAVEYRVIGAGGEVSWLELRAAFEHDETGRPVRMVGTAWNVTARRSQLGWLVGLLELHPDPIHVLSSDNRVQWANQAARELGQGAGAEMVGEVPWEKQPKLAGQGVPELLAQARAAPGAAVTTEVTYRHEDTGHYSSYLVRAVGVGGFVATQMADVSDQRAAECAARDRSRRVTGLNQALIRAVDTDDVVAAVIEHVLPMVDADGLIVHDLTAPEPRLVGDAGYPAGFRAEIETRDWQERLMAAMGGSGPQFASSLAELDRMWPALSAMARRGGKGAWALLPLVVGDRRVGSCVISWPAPRRFAADDKSLLSTVALVIAQALGKAQTYEEARHRAERLQQELLPGVLPHTVAVRTAARYRTAAGEEIGGDWYDTIPLPGGRTLAVIGDVLGHGLEQAITMGILRHAALTVAALDLPVDEIMAHLNDVAGRLGPSVSATCLLVLYDPTSGLCSVAGAGHPPPIALPPGPHGKAHTLDVPVGPPLGRAQVPSQVAETVLAEGSVLVLFTDGLLGGSTPDAVRLTDVVTRYAAQAPALAGRTPDAAWLDALCDTITARLPADPDHQDDAALLTLSTGRVPADRIAAWDLPWAPESAGLARTVAASQITEWGLDGLSEPAMLIISELIGNAVRHGVGLGTDVGDEDDGLIRLRLLHLDDALICEVYDGSQATPRVRHPLLDDEFGRGLQLVALMAAQWGTRYTERGKCIWARCVPGTDGLF